MQGQGLRPAVLEGPRQLQTPLQQGDSPPVVTEVTGETAGSSECSNVERPRIATRRKGALQPGSSFPEVATEEPEPTQPPASRRAICASLIECPAQGRRASCRARLRAAPATPTAPDWSVGVGLLPQRQEEFGVGPARRLRFAALLQPLQPVLPDRLQHREARLAVRPLDRAQQALLDQSVQTAEDVERPSGLATASTASRVQPPTKTASRRKSVCSSGSAGRSSRRSRRAASAGGPERRAARRSAAAAAAPAAPAAPPAAGAAPAPPPARSPAAARPGAGRSRPPPGRSRREGEAGPDRLRPLDEEPHRLVLGGAPPARPRSGIGSASGGTGYSCSPAAGAAAGWWPAPSAASGRTRAARRRRARPRRPARRLSSTSSSRLPARASRTASAGGRPPPPAVPAHRHGRGDQLGIGERASGTKKTPSGKASSSSAAACRRGASCPCPRVRSASRDGLRGRGGRATIRARSCSRPRSGVAWCGRLWSAVGERPERRKLVGRGRGGGAGRPHSGSSRSRRRCSP